MGLYYQEAGKQPWQYSCTGTRQDWRKDARRADILARNRVEVGQWRVPAGDQGFEEILQALRKSDNCIILEQAIWDWSRLADPKLIDNLLLRAGWVTSEYQSPDWYVVDSILKMPDGEERNHMIARAKLESPTFFDECEKDPFCGM